MAASKRNRKREAEGSGATAQAGEVGASGGDAPGVGAEWKLLGLVVGVTLVAFLPVLWADFVNWDDPYNITENVIIRGLGLHQLQWMWTSRLLGVYEPLSWMLKAATYCISGPSAVGFHAVSWVLHAANAGWVFLIARRMIGRAVQPANGMNGATIAAILFAAHPLRAECVAWATGQPYLLAGFFALGSVWAYLRGLDNGVSRATYVALSVFLFACSLLAKAIAVPLPALLLVLDVYPLKRLGGATGWTGARARGVWLEKIFWLVPALWAAWISIAAPVFSLVRPEQIGIMDRVAIACYGFAFNLWKSVWPSGLSPFYPLPEHVGWSRPFVAAAVTVGVALLGVVAVRRRAPALVVAGAAYVLMVGPVCGLVRHGDQLAADRYSYLSCIGFAVAAGAMLGALHRRGRLAGAAMITVLAALTWRQASFWHDSQLLWTHALDAAPDNWLAHNNLANDALNHNRWDEARVQLDEALRIKPDYPDALYTRGILADRQHRTEEAIGYYRRAMVHLPFHPAVANLGAALMRLGRTQEAYDVLRAGLSADPTHREVRSNLAGVCIQLGQLEPAEKLLTDLLVDEPNNADFLNNLGIAYGTAGKAAEAAEQFRRVLAIKPTYRRARYHYAEMLEKLGRKKEAVEEYIRVQKEDPGDTDARTGLAAILLETGELEAAVRELESAHRMKPDDVRVCNQLAWIYATTTDDSIRNPTQAVDLASQLCRQLNYRNPQALDTLAAAYASAGNYSQAVEWAQKAVEMARLRKDPDLLRAIEGRLATYRGGHAYREASRGVH